MRKVNLGCGTYKREGFINIDANPRVKPDIVRDLTKGLPFDDSSVDQVVALHFLEHLTCVDMMFVIEECYRVLRPGAQLVIRVPLRDFTSLDHLQIFDAKSFDPLERPEVPDYYQRNFRWKIAAKSIRPDKVSGHDNLDISLEAVK